MPAYNPHPASGTLHQASLNGVESVGVGGYVCVCVYVCVCAWVGGAASRAALRCLSCFNACLSWSSCRLWGQLDQRTVVGTLPYVCTSAHGPLRGGSEYPLPIPPCPSRGENRCRLGSGKPQTRGGSRPPHTCDTPSKGNQTSNRYRNASSGMATPPLGFGDGGRGGQKWLSAPFMA